MCSCATVHCAAVQLCSCAPVQLWNCAAVRLLSELLTRSRVKIKLNCQKVFHCGTRTVTIEFLQSVTGLEIQVSKQRHTHTLTHTYTHTYTHIHITHTHTRAHSYSRGQVVWCERTADRSVEPADKKILFLRRHDNDKISWLLKAKRRCDTYVCVCMCVSVCVCVCVCVSVCVCVCVCVCPKHLFL